MKQEANSILTVLKGGTVNPKTKDSNLFDSPDVNQSTSPLNHDDKFSFMDCQVAYAQKNNDLNSADAVSYEDLEHNKGAEQRKKMFASSKSKDIPNPKSLMGQSQIKKEDDQGDEINSPSLTSNSFMNIQQEDAKIQDKKGTFQLNKLRTEETSNHGGGNKAKQSFQNNIQLIQRETSELSTQKQDSLTALDRGSLGGPLIQTISKQNSQKILEENTLLLKKGLNQSNNVSHLQSLNSTNGIIYQVNIDERNKSGSSQLNVNSHKDNSSVGNEELYPSEHRGKDMIQSSGFQGGVDNLLQSNAFFMPKTLTQSESVPGIMNLNPSTNEKINDRRQSHYLELPQPLNINSSNQTSNSQYGRKNSLATQISQRTQSKTKKRNFLKAFYFTYKFLQKMRFVRKYKNIYMLEKKHFKLIKDNAFGGLYERIKNSHICLKILDNIYYFIFDIKSPLRTFQPDSLLLLFFEFSLFFVLLFLLFYIPLKVCLGTLADFQEKPEIQSFVSAAPYVLLVEVAVSLNTAYFSEGSTVIDRKLIFKKYLGFKFWIDICTIFCLLQSSIVPLLFILRISQIFVILNDFDENFQIQFKYPTIFELFKLVLIIIFVAHLCACGFCLILNYQTESDTWITKANLEDKDWVHVYVASLYFSFTTMITVGFGDIVPVSLLERIYVIIIQLASCGVFAYSINTIGSIFQEIAKRSAEYRQQKQEIMDYMGRREITKSTQIKILKYLEYFHSSGGGNQKGYSVLNILSKRLKDAVFKEYYGGLLLQFKLLSRQFSEKFLRTLSLYMKETTLSPGEVLYNQGELDPRIFFVQSGEIEQFIDLQDNGHKDIILGTFKQGDYFGQQGFLGNVDCKNSARSINVSQIVYCAFEDFITVIRQFPNDYETYCSLKDSVQFNQDQIDIVCMSCGRYNHYVQNCPLLHFELDKEAHIRRFIHSDPQERNETFSRRKQDFIKIDKIQDNNQNEKTPKSQIPKEVNYSDQRFNVYQNFMELKDNLRNLRVKLANHDDRAREEEDKELVNNEPDDKIFIQKTKSPGIYHHKQNSQFLECGDNDDGENDDEYDDYDEEFAEYEDVMGGDRDNYIGNNHNYGGYQRVSTLSGSQVHVPTEKSVFMRMPSSNNFHPSGGKTDGVVSEYSSEDKELDDEDEYDDQKEKRRSTVDESEDKEADRSLQIYGKLSSKPSSGYISGSTPHQVSFKEEFSQTRKVNAPRQRSVKVDIQNQTILEEDPGSPQHKSRFYLGNENANSSFRYGSRHQTAMASSSFNNIAHNFETYFRNSNLENSNSLASLQNQNSKRKATVLSSIGQNSSKLRNQGSFDVSINRTGTLNSKGIIKNTNQLSKKVSDQKSFQKMPTSISKKDSSMRVAQTSTQYAKFAQTRADNLSEKQKIQNPISLKQDLVEFFIVMNLDKFCEFTHYFPDFNITNIMKQLKKIQKIKLDLIIKQIKQKNKVPKASNPSTSQMNLQKPNRASVLTNNHTIGNLHNSMQTNGEQLNGGGGDKLMFDSNQLLQGEINNIKIQIHK